MLKFLSLVKTPAGSHATPPLEIRSIDNYGVTLPVIP